MTTTSHKGAFFMKKFIFKYGHFLSAFALFVATTSANRNCYIIFHQPQLPDSVKKLKKF